MDEQGMVIGTQNSRRFFGGGNSGTKFLHGVVEKLQELVRN
jgi:hypothetical protein